jgi:hypothetical protein
VDATAAPTATPLPPTATPEPPTPTPETAEAEAAWTADGAIGADEYAHQAEGGGVTLYWSNDAEHLYAALSAPTTGWVAVGFDPQVAMLGANYVFGYVQDGQLYVEDMYGTLRSGQGSHPPDVDLGGRNDILESAGREEAGSTVIEFKIPLDSGDENDKPLLPGMSYRALLAYGSSDDFQSFHAERGSTEITLD